MHIMVSLMFVVSYGVIMIPLQFVISDDPSALALIRGE